MTIAFRSFPAQRILRPCLLGWAVRLALASSASPSPAASFYAVDLFTGGENHVVQYRIPSLITTKGATLIAVCDARLDKAGDAPNKIDLVMRTSRDGGRTWTNPRVIVDFPGYTAADDSRLVVDLETGTIWMAYDYVVPEPQGLYRGRLVRVHLRRSDDEGVTWSLPIDLAYLTRGKNFWLRAGVGRGLYTDGVIVIPMYTNTGGDGTLREAVLVISQDHGRTWSLSHGVGRYAHEPQAARLSGGRIMLNLRTNTGYRQVATTADLGESWSDVHEDHALPDPSCQGSLINYDDGPVSRLIFTNPDDKKERKNLVLRVSDDEGKSWRRRLSIYPGSTGYSCLTQLPGGDVGLLYERDDYRRIVFTIVPRHAIGL